MVCQVLQESADIFTNPVSLIWFSRLNKPGQIIYCAKNVLDRQFKRQRMYTLFGINKPNLINFGIKRLKWNVKIGKALIIFLNWGFSLWSKLMSKWKIKFVGKN